MPPGPLQALFPAKVTRVESLRPGLQHAGDGWSVAHWLEALETEAEPELVADDGTVAVWRHNKHRYLAAWPTLAMASAVIERAARDAGLALHRLPEGLRMRRAGRRRFVFNYANAAREVPGSITGTVVLGGRMLPPAGVMVVED